MEKYNIELLEKNRMGNNADNYEWQVVTEWLSTGKIKNKEEMQICYDNMQKNKKWYYDINYRYNANDEFVILVSLIDIALFFVTIFGYAPFMNSIVAKIINFSNYHYTLTETLPNVFDFVIWALSTVGIMAGNFAFFKKIIVDKKVDDLQETLEFGLGIKHSKSKIISKLKEKILAKIGTQNKAKAVGSLKDYVDKELTERGTNQDEEIIKRQNEEHASAFVKLIGEDMKSIIANPYPNCEEDLDALHNLANEYVESIVKEQEANLTSKIALKLSGSKDFYGKLNDLEAKIKRNMEINKMRKYNDGYLSDIIKDSSKAVEQPQQIYNGPVVGGHIPTVEEQFQADLQVPTNDTGSARKLKPNN